MTTFAELSSKLREANSQKPFSSRLLAIDPGETTGFARFVKTELVETYQVPTKSVEEYTTKTLLYLLDFDPHVMVIEDYRVYAWKADMHKWASLHTPRIIGSTQTICHINSIPLFKQSAQIAKQFCTDKKLKDWGFYQKGKPHARDAIRHGCYFILFNKTYQK